MKNGRVVTIELQTVTWYDVDPGVWVGYCPVLNIYSQGRDVEEAYAAIESAVTLWLKHSEQRMTKTMIRIDDLYEKKRG